MLQIPATLDGLRMIKDRRREARCHSKSHDTIVTMTLSRIAIVYTLTNMELDNGLGNPWKATFLHQHGASHFYVSESECLVFGINLRILVRSTTQAWRAAQHCSGWTGRRLLATCVLSRPDVNAVAFP